MKISFQIKTQKYFHGGAVFVSAYYCDAKIWTLLNIWIVVYYCCCNATIALFYEIANKKIKYKVAFIFDSDLHHVIDRHPVLLCVLDT